MRLLSSRRARAGLGIYFVVLVPLTAIFEGLLIRAGDSIDHHPGWVLGLMWTPAFASLVARLVLREGSADVSFALSGERIRATLLFAWLFPVCVGVAAYGAAWLGGLATFEVAALRFAPSISSPIARFGIRLGAALTVGTLIGCLTSAGEELGWRGYMLTRLIAAGFPAPILVSGLVWALWHVPLIVTGTYATGQNDHLASAGLFILAVLPAAFLFARLRLASGSVWPAVLAHASWNSVIQSVFDRATTGDEATRWVGESGVLVVIAVGIVAWVASRMRAFAIR